MALDGEMPIILGPNPLNKALQPSFLTTVPKHLHMLKLLTFNRFALAEDWSLVFITSSGHVTVAPIVPAAPPAIKWMRVSFVVNKYGI